MERDGTGQKGTGWGREGRDGMKIGTGWGREGRDRTERDWTR